MIQTQLSAVLKEKANSHYICNLPSTATIAECIHKMYVEKIGAIAIIDNDRLVGLFTERDILRKIYAEHIDTETTPVSKVMTTDVIYAKPETTIEEAMATFTEKRFRHLPVMQDSKLIGLVSMGDITKWIINNQKSEIELLSDYINGVYR